MSNQQSWYTNVSRGILVNISVDIFTELHFFTSLVLRHFQQAVCDLDKSKDCTVCTEKTKTAGGKTIIKHVLLGLPYLMER